MRNVENQFEIDFLDHVAIRVKNLEISAEWYQNVLGLKRYKTIKWGAYPIFMLGGKSGIALFPATVEDPILDNTSKNVGIDHFAFNVNLENFEKALKKYAELNLVFTIKDHHYFKSVYTQDPDGHTVELTTIMVAEDSFYQQ